MVRSNLLGLVSAPSVLVSTSLWEYDVQLIKSPLAAQRSRESVPASIYFVDP